MGSAIRRRVGALGCALSLLLCLPLVKPWLDMRTIDDGCGGPVGVPPVNYREWFGART